MNIDKNTESYIIALAQKAAISAVQEQRSQSMAQLATCVAAEPKSSSVSQEFDHLAKSTYELEECVKVLADKLSGVLRNNTEAKLGKATAFNDKDAPLVNGLAERVSHIQNVTYAVRDLIDRVQLTN